MRGLVIRAAGPDDVAALVALDSFAAPDNDRAASIARWVRGGQCICADFGGNPAGYAVMHSHFFGQPMLELVMVARAHRSIGVGTALIRHVQTLAGPVLWTSTNQSNHAMQSLLQKLGFRRSGIVEGLDEGDPELIYRLSR
ncbi:MAG: hypothetical protein ABS76_19885 [Pelagibacterium sp. SCN 64-44]|nr:MAG: hypothetical protein ABS76_19885 [Pelagibacterium sp. SCN 64-44]